MGAKRGGDALSCDCVGASVTKTGGAEDADKKTIESDGVALLPINDATLGETVGEQGGILLPELCTRWEDPSCEGGNRPGEGDPALGSQASEHLSVSQAAWPGVRQRRHIWTKLHPALEQPAFALYP